MSIDKIGKGSPIAPTAETGAISGSDSIEKPFSISPSTPPPPVAPTLLDQVRGGQISIDQYLDARIDEATAHVAGRVPAEQLAFLKGALRDQLVSDPQLVDLVRHATGSIPSAPTDDRG